MYSELPSSLDNLAAYGIVNFDPEAYIKGTAPRYVGSPNNAPMGLPFEQPLQTYGINPGAQLSGQPSRDAYVIKEGHSENPSWKTVLASVLVTGAAVFAGMKYGPKLAARFRKNSTLPANVTSVKNVPPAAVAPVAAAVPPTTTATAAKTSRIKKMFANVKNWFKSIGPKIKGLSTWKKVAGGSVAGILILYAAYKAFAGHAPRPQQGAQLEPQQAAQSQQEHEVPTQQQHEAQPLAEHEVQPQPQAQPHVG